MKLNNLLACILIDGKPATEYPDEDFDRKPVDDAASRYIEVVEGARFEIRCTVPPKYNFGAGVDGLVFSYKVDGVSVTPLALTKTVCESKNGFPVARTGFRSNRQGREMEERFRFGKIRTYEGALTALQANGQAQAFKHIGEIVIHVKRQTGRRSETRRGSGDKTGALHGNSDASFHEKVIVKEAQSLAIVTDAATVYGSSGFWLGVDVDRGPIATFIFKYRSKEGLRQLGVIERTPTPPPPIALEDRDPATLTQEELIEVVRRVQASKEERQIKIKQETRDANLRQLGAIKREHEDDEIEVAQDARPGIANKRRKTEVIDLSD